jgi:hypothetical protein
MNREGVIKDENNIYNYKDNIISIGNKSKYISIASKSYNGIEEVITLIKSISDHEKQDLSFSFYKPWTWF